MDRPNIKHLFKELVSEIHKGIRRFVADRTSRYLVSLHQRLEGMMGILKSKEI